MNLIDELNKELRPDELNKISFYIAHSELMNFENKKSQVIYSDRMKSKCAFYNSTDMDMIKPYKPISKLIPFEKWIKNKSNDE